jgi:hypothetical protein
MLKITYHGVRALDESRLPFNIRRELGHWRDRRTRQSFFDAIEDRMIGRLGGGRAKGRVVFQLHDSLAQ